MHESVMECVMVYSGPWSIFLSSYQYHTVLIMTTFYQVLISAKASLPICSPLRFCWLFLGPLHYISTSFCSFAEVLIWITPIVISGNSTSWVEHFKFGFRYITANGSLQNMGYPVVHSHKWVITRFGMERCSIPVVRFNLGGDIMLTSCLL